MLVLQIAQEFRPITLYMIPVNVNRFQNVMRLSRNMMFYSIPSSACIFQAKEEPLEIQSAMYGTVNCVLATLLFKSCLIRGLCEGHRRWVWTSRIFFSSDTRIFAKRRIATVRASVRPMWKCSRNCVRI